MSLPSPASRSSPQALRLGWAVVLGVLLLQLVSRYLPSPWAVFVADDWPNWARSTFYTSHAEAALAGLRDPHRPLSMLAVEVVYRWFGPRPVYWTLLSLFTHSLMLGFIMRMGLELTGSRRVAALQGVIFALLPNLTETWHWSTQIVNEATCGLLFYALSGWLFVAYSQRAGTWRLAGSALAYAVGLFSYEQGILLPAAFLVLRLDRRDFTWRRVGALVPFGALALLYAAWRLTNAFGLNTWRTYPPHMQVQGFSWWFLGWNARQVTHWWIGDRFFGAILAGLQSFATLSLWTRRLLLLGDLAVVSAGAALWARWFRRDETAGQDGVNFGRSVLFALLWFVAGIATSLVSYTAGRLNVLPAMGAALLIALALDRLSWRIWLPALFVPAWICLAANQGTAENFRQAGTFNRNVFAHLQHTRDAWEPKEVLFFDTASLRHRLTPGLLHAVGLSDAVWAEYGNALLFRGFVPGGMVSRITGQEKPRVKVVHDVENGARIEGDRLLWHARYHPDEPYETPLDRVFVVDAWAVGSRRH